MNQKQTDITTGKQIRHLRTQSGMTQEELAGKLNVRPRYRGLHHPDASHSYFQVPLWEIALPPTTE